MIVLRFREENIKKVLTYVRISYILNKSSGDENISGDDALRGNTRFHSEHVG